VPELHEITTTPGFLAHDEIRISFVTEGLILQRNLRTIFEDIRNRLTPCRAGDFLLTERALSFHRAKEAFHESF
jgi:hypothetical protein